MIKSKLIQTLSNETPNDHGFVVLSDGIDWSRYANNPVLLRQHSRGSAPIGNVTGIFRDGNAWKGTLSFADTEEGREAAKLYESGVCRAVSIGGYSQRVEDKLSKQIFATYFDVYEISLVDLPSNPDAISNFEGNPTLLTTPMFYEKGHQMLTQLSAKDNQIINKYKSTMEEIKKTVEEVVETALETSLQNVVDHQESALESAGNEGEATEAENAVAEPKTEQGCKLEAKKPVITRIAEILGLSSKEVIEQMTEIEQGETQPNETTLATKAKTHQEKANVTDSGSQSQEPRILDPQKVQLKSELTMQKPTLQYLATDEGKMKFGAMCRLSAMDSNRIANPENAHLLDATKEVVNVIAADEGFMALMSNIAVSRQNSDRADRFSTIVDRAKTNLASGANSINFINSSPDLAVIEWLSLFFRQLFPVNEWANRCGRVSGSDKAGVIWVESSMSPKVYFGDRAPVGMANYLYDDTPRGLATKVFSLQPVLFQSANVDLLAYDQMGMGQSEAFRILVAKIHNYALQKIAESATTDNKVSMSGTDVIPSANNFPINPAAAGNLKGLSLADIRNLQAKFINQNYYMEEGAAELVTDAVFYNSLLAQPEIMNTLFKMAGGVRPMNAEYGGFRIQPRSLVSAYNTTTNVVADAEKYLDGKVQMSDGSVPAYTPPTLTATTYGLALGFIPSEVLLAVGNTNVHMVADPNSYGWKFSMDMRFGAGAARANGKGIGLIVPTTTV